MRKFQIALAVLALAFFVWAQQDKSKRPSPPGTASVTLNGKNITVDYSRPKVQDPKSGQRRKVYGGLVPYGEVWRTGANEATTLKTDADLDVNGTTVPAGTYTLFTIPQENGDWTLIVSKKTGEWGIPYPGQSEDLARIPIKATKTNHAVDQFTISFDKRGNNEAVMNLDWENTRASVPIRVK